MSGYAKYPQVDDLSLFMGTAGVGYFYLRTLCPLEIECILAPRLKSTVSSGDFNLSLDDIKCTVLAKYFQRSIEYCSKLSPDSRDDHMKKIAEILNDRNQGEQRQVVPDETTELKLLDFISLENSIVDLAMLAEPGCLTETRIRVNHELLSSKTDLDLQLQVPQIGSHIRLHDLKGDCILIVTKPKGIATYKLSAFSATLLRSIDGKSNIMTITNRMIETVLEEQRNQASTLVLKQIKQFMLIGVFDWCEQ